MTLHTFDDLLAAARSQPQRQRLLMVFAGAEPGSAPSAAQRAAFDAGRGGELAPLMCVDKTPEELPDFAALCAQARRAGPPWAIVFAAALAGSTTAAPSSEDADAPLQRMVENIRQGQLDGLVPFDTQGQAVHLR